MAMALAVVMVACERTVEKPGAPTIANTIVGMVFDHGAGPESITLTGYFTTADGATYSAASSKPSVATATVSGAVLTVTPKAAGSTNVTVTATDENGKVSQTFSVTVNAPEPIVNNPPTVRTIPDKTLLAGTTDTVILSRYAEDPEGARLMYAADSSNEAVATVSVANGVLMISAVAKGTATITVTVDDGTNSPVAREFDVTVTVSPDEVPDNEPPEQALIDDIGADQLRRGGTVDIDLSMYYDDPEDEDLEYTAESSMPDVAAVTLSGEMLTIEGVGVGKARIAVSASDGTNTRRQSFSVTVGSNPPVATTTLPTTISLGLAGNTQPLDLSLYFSDPEGDALTYTAMSDNTDVATVTGPGNGSVITITAVAAKSPTEVGTATITVTAQDADNAAVSLDLFVTVDPTGVDNTAPAVRGIDDMVLETGEQSTLDLGMHFVDAHELTYEATSIMEMYVTVAVDGSMLTITAVDEGTARITVKATDSYGAAATTFFMVTVVPPNMAPVVTEIPNQSLEMDFADKMKTLDLSMYFSDPDSDALSYEATSSNPMYATATVDGSMLTIEAVAAGTAMITVTASDGAASVQDMFTVTVTNPAVPTLKKGFRAVTFAHDGAPQTIMLEDHFNRATSYNAVSDDETVVMAAVNDEQTMLTLTRVGAGSTVVEVTPSNSGGAGTIQLINVTVDAEPEEQEDLPPRYVEGSLPSSIPLEPGHEEIIDVEGAFVEDEEEDLTITLEVSDEDPAVVRVTRDGNTITITALATTGDATVTIVATDTDGLTAEHSITVSVRATLMPERSDMNPEPVTLEVGGAPEVIEDVSGYFDNHGLADLEYSANSSDDAVAKESIDGSMLMITPMGPGTATVWVTASNVHGSVVLEIMVTVNATPPTAVAEGIPDVTLTGVGDDTHVELNLYFEAGAGGGPITSYDADVVGDKVRATVRNDLLLIEALKAGSDTITVTATDADGETSAPQTIMVTVSMEEEIELAPTNPTQIPSQKVVLGTPKTIDISEHFTGATNYRASGVDDTVRAAVTADGMLTLTPVAHGTVEVRVTAINSAGEVSDDFDVTVQAKPMFKEGKSLPALRINAADLATPVASALPDLSTLFEDPDGDDMSLMYSTKTDAVGKVFVVKRTYATDGTTENTVVPASEDDRNKALMATGKDVNLYARAVGTAMITITVTDEDKLETIVPFAVMVIGAANTPPTQGDDGSNATSLTGTDRLKLSGEPEKVIDAKPINDYFFDADFNTASGDMLTFKVEHTDLLPADVPAPTGTPPTVTVPEDNKIAAADQVAFVDLSTYMWDGDPLGGEDKFTVTVRPRNPGAAQTIVIIATDKAGAQNSHSFQVAVNNPPKPEGAQGTPLKLSSFKEAEGLKSTLPDGTTANTVNVPIVAPFVEADGTGGGYFSDADMTADSATSDTLTCSFRPSVTGDTAPATLAWDGTTGNNAEDNTESITLVVTTKVAYSAGFVPMMVAVSCTDGLETTAEQTFTVSVTAQASIQ